MAGLDSSAVKKATVVNWMQLGTYKTRENLLQFKSIKSELCLACGENQKEDLHHLLFLCPFYDEIRQPALSKLFLANPSIMQIMDNAQMKVTLVLDPKSKLLPEQVSEQWSITTSEVYNICRDMCYNMHNKREKFYKENEKP